MRIFDSHVHIFNKKIIGNVIPRTGLIQALSLEVEDIENRLSPSALVEQMRAANVVGALMLPTSDVHKLAKVNRECIQLAADIPGLSTAGTLHPDFNAIEAELQYLSRASVHVVKLCSFSQKLALNHPKTLRMFDRIQSFNEATENPFSVVLDTLTLADRYFGSDPAHSTTPRLLMDLVERYPGIKFIGAHMGGLGAPFEHLDRDLRPMPNLYLDTSNAAHTLSADQFVRMLDRHGPEHILFGTDWPWFLHGGEIPLIDSRMEAAGFTGSGKQAVFSGNIEKILRINGLAASR
jgi:predicted TIM-barrel fold metal-dependent hydrolase